MPKAFITGLSGPALAATERDFLAAEQPAGIILFARNIVDPGQVRRLVDDALSAIGAGALVLIDQEGGRVQRLRPPHWRALPPARRFATCYAADPAQAVSSARIVSRLVASDLRALGITMNCAPVLDVPAPGAHDIIGDRAYGDDVATIVALGRAVAAGFMDGGVVPVIKHIPGHGRAMADSHLALPVVDADRASLEASDFAPFKALADLPAAMTAHVVLTAIDPAAPASTSAEVTRDIIRGLIGFDGLLMSDDLSMKALTGTMADRARSVLRAGSDLALHCSGNLDEMTEVAGAAPALAGESLRRFERALDVTAATLPFDIAAAESALAVVQATKTVA
jgi:beta-N-acetylhexosaminidase